MARSILGGPALRDEAELERLREQMFAIHWRLREWRLRPRSIDFTDLARTAWFGPLDLGAARLVENDLAIGDAPVSRADDISRGTAASGGELCGS